MKTYIWIRIYRVIRKSLRKFGNRMHNNQDRHGRKDISSTCKLGQKIGLSVPLLTCSPSAWPSRLLHRRCRKSPRDLWITIYIYIIFEISPTCFDAYFTIFRENFLSLVQNYLLFVMLRRFQSLRYNIYGFYNTLHNYQTKCLEICYVLKFIFKSLKLFLGMGFQNSKFNENKNFHVRVQWWPHCKMSSAIRIQVRHK